MTGSGTSPDARRPPHLGSRRLWLFRLTSALLAPSLLLALLEMGLRLGHRGHPTSFYIESDRTGTYMTNPRFGWRFFGPALARMPEPHLLPAKPPGAFRVFVLGGSAAMGVPNPSLGFARILEVMLRHRHPGVSVEVVNAAMTAANSHVVLEIARDCAARQPDLFLVYMGNNEVVGPYGPGAIFQAWCPSRPLVRATLLVKSTRTGQLLADTIGSLRPQRGPRAWRGMAMAMECPVTADDPRLEPTYANFRRNLTAICRVGRRAGAAVVLSTVAVNLRDCPPFGSRHRSDLRPGDLETWEATYRAGVELQDDDRWREALTQYEAASRLDDRFAELQFRMGESLAALGRPELARRRFLAACDLDVLRFRADQRINAAIRDVFAEQSVHGVRLADAERALAADRSEDGDIPGEDLFYEHVHLKFDGNYRVARALLAQVESALPRLRALRRRHSVPSRRQCARTLAMTPWDEYQSLRQVAEMVSHPPFSGQLGHAVRMAAIGERTAALARLSSRPGSAQDARRLYRAALERAPGDWRLHHRYGKLLLAGGETQLAVDQMRAALEAYPGNLPLQVDLGIAESMSGRHEEAIALLQKALEACPEHLVAHSNLVTALAREGRIDEAAAHLRKATEIDPTHDDAYVNLGVVLAEQGDTRGAIAHFRRALEVDPGNVVARFDLGIALARLGRTDEAIASFRRALDSRPDLVAAHVNLGIALARQGDVQEAVAHFRAALEIKPGDPVAHYYLGSGLASQGRIEEAVTSLRRAVELDPDHYDAHISLGIALAASDVGEAMELFQRAQDIDPENPTAYCDLGLALAGQGRVDDAIAELRKALSVDPGYVAAHLAMARLLASRGRIDEAMASWRQALRIRPDLEEARRELQRLSRARRTGRGSGARLGRGGEPSAVERQSSVRKGDAGSPAPL